MEQTLGKRIAQNRKRLGLTQDALAEKLGITAQAVSKWENNQSCPDITMLPKLAEIFDISTDALLGREDVVHTGEIVADSKNSDDNKGWSWHYHLDSSFKDGLFFAILAIWMGVLTLLTRHLEISFWSLLWPSALLIWGAKEWFYGHFSLFHTVVALIGGYYLLKKLNFALLPPGAGTYLFPIIILIIGIALLVDIFRKNKIKRHYFHPGHKNEEAVKHTVDTEKGTFDSVLQFAERTQRIALEELSGGNADVSFGELVIDLTDCQRIKDNCEITLTASFGALTVKIPQRFRFEISEHCSFGSIKTVGIPYDTPEATIYINANASFGEVSIQYV